MKKSYLLNNVDIESLHDCVISSIDYSDNKLEIIIDEFGIPAEVKAQFHKGELEKINKIVYTVLLSERFLDEPFMPSVTQINRKVLFGRQVFKYYTLKRFIEIISKTKNQLSVYDVYYNGFGCVLFLVEEPLGATRAYEICLVADEITLEWK